MKIRPRMTSYLKAPDPECLQMCRLYCLLFIEDPLALFLFVVGCIQLCAALRAFRGGRGPVLRWVLSAPYNFEID